MLPLAHCFERNGRFPQRNFQFSDTIHCFVSSVHFPLHLSTHIQLTLCTLSSFHTNSNTSCCISTAFHVSCFGFELSFIRNQMLIWKKQTLLFHWLDTFQTSLVSHSFLLQDPTCVPNQISNVETHNFRVTIRTGTKKIQYLGVKALKRNEYVIDDRESN